MLVEVPILETPAGYVGPCRSHLYDYTTSCGSKENCTKALLKHLPCSGKDTR